MTTIIISNGTTVVSTDVSLTTTYTVDAAGVLDIINGGTVSATTVNGGGIVDINAGGSAIDTAIGTGGETDVESGAVATGTTIEAGGTLDVLAGGTANETTDAGALVIQGTVDGLTINAGATATVTLRGLVEGTVTDDGTFQYANGFTNTGSMSVAGSPGNTASLAVTGLFLNAGIFNIGADAIVTVDGTYQQRLLNGGPGTLLELQLEGEGSGQFGAVAVTGAADLRDSSGLDIITGQSFPAGTNFTIMTFTPGSLVGMFGFLTGSGGNSAGTGTSQNLGDGLTAGLLYNDSAGGIQLEYVATPATTADTWTAGDTGTWTTAAEWSAGVPTFYSDATIGADAIVTLATDATVNSLTLAAGATLTTGSGDGLSTEFLTVDAGAALTVGGEMTVDQSTTSVLNNGTVEVAGPLLDIDANVLGSGSFQIDAGATLEFEHLVEPTAVLFNGVGGALFINTNPQLFSGTLVRFNIGGVLEVAEIITGVTVDHVSGSEQNLILSGNSGFVATIALNPHDDYTNANFQITVAGSVTTIQVLTPAVTAVTEVPSTGDLGVGQSDALTLTMNEPVTVTGTPTLTLNDGGVATYDSSKSTPTALVFDYTVAATDTNVASLAAAAIGLIAGAGIADAFGHTLTDVSLIGLSQIGPAIVTPTTFQHGEIATSGSLAGQYLWSNFANWTNGVPVNGGGAIIPDALEGFDDIPALSLTTLTEGGGSASVIVPSGSLYIGTLVSQVGADGSISYLEADANFLGLATPASVTVGAITGAGLGQYAAYGANSSFSDQSATDAGYTYIASGGSIVLSPPPSGLSFINFDSGTVELEHPAATNAVALTNVAPGDVLELPGNSVSSASFAATGLTVTTNDGTYAFTNVSYASPVAGYTAAFDAATGLEAITLTAPTVFQHGAIATSGSLAGQYLWSNPANWTNGVPVNDGAAIIPDMLAGFDDIPALSLTTLTEGGGSASVIVPSGSLYIGTLVSQVGADGSISYLEADANFLGLATPASVTVGAITGAGLGQYAAYGANSSFSDQSATDAGYTYIASGGSIVLSPPPSGLSFINFDSGTVELEHPAATNAVALTAVAPGDVLELPGNSVGGASFGVTSLTVTTNDGTYAFNNVSYASPVAGYTAAFDAATGLEALTFVSCFCPGTRIVTDRGERPVESLVAGDRVVARFAEDGVAPVVWIGHRHIDCHQHPNPHTVWPVRVGVGAFGDGLPCRDLWLSPDHAVFVGDVLIPIRHLINGDTIEQMAADEVTYYHLELPRHDVLMAEHLTVESYLDTGGRANFDGPFGAIHPHPDFASHVWEAFACAPLMVTGPEVDAARRLLEKRAGFPMIKESTPLMLVGPTVTGFFDVAQYSRGARQTDSLKVARGLSTLFTS